MIGPQSLIECSLDTEVVERIIRLDFDPSARLREVTPLPAAANTVCRVDLEGGPSLVLKLRQGEGLPTFDAEAFRLDYLARETSLPAPRVIARRKDGAAGPYTYILQTFLPGVSWERLRKFAPLSESAAVERELGGILGRLHRENQSHGFYEVLPRVTPHHRSWPEFFSSLWQDRIKELLSTDRLDSPTLDAVEWIHSHLGRLLRMTETPRLVHGNLGGTKIICNEVDGVWKPCGFLDPSLVYAHRELDLALLELRSTVNGSFFEGYREEMPIDEGYEFRKRIYMLYHVLDEVRLHGHTHQILRAIEIVREILRECAL